MGRTATLIAALLIAACPAAALADPMPRAGWIGLKAPNFYVVGDVSAHDLREVARRLEQFREAIGVILPKAVLTTSSPTTVLVFKSHKSYEPLKPLYNGKIRDDIWGYFQPARSINYMTFTMAGGIERLDIVFHEYVHLVVNNNLESAPLWFNEGLAEYYRTFQITGNGTVAALGKVQPAHLYVLREHFLPLADVVSVDRESPLYNESARNSAFYAESWAFVHYLMLGNEQKYAKHIGAFVSALSNGVTFEDACQRVLGVTGAALQKELQSYVQHEVFTMQGVRFTERIGRIDDLTPTGVPEAEVHATLGDVLLNMDRPGDARTELDRALALDPTFAPAHTSLGLIAARANQWDEARKQLEIAVNSPSATYVSEYEFAYMTTQGRPTLPPDDALKVEQALRKAIAMNPLFADAYALLASRLGQTDGGLDEGLTMITRAIELSPGREDYVVVAANLLAQKQDFSRARALLDPLLRGATDATVRAAARQLLSSITDFERRKAALASNLADRPSMPAQAGAPSPVRSFSAPRVVPTLRTMEAGESRMFGKLTAVECSGEAITLVVKASDGVLRAHARKFKEVELLSYRDDLRGVLQCGPRTPADPVLLTFHPDPNSASEGTAVAVEFVPLDYAP